MQRAPLPAPPLQAAGAMGAWSESQTAHGPCDPRQGVGRSTTAGAPARARPPPRALAAFAAVLAAWTQDGCFAALPRLATGAAIHPGALGGCSGAGRPRRTTLYGKGSPPLRTHRPNGSPFATSAAQLIRRPMDRTSEVDPEMEAHVKALISEDAEERRAGAYAIWRTCTKASPALLEALSQAVLDEDFKVRWDAALSLEKLGKLDRWSTDPYIARLAHKLKKEDTDPFEKVLLLEALGRIGTPAHVYSRIIGDQLAHEDWRVRLVACEALGKLGPEVHLHKAAIVRLKRDEHEMVRKAAEKTLFQVPIDKPGWLKVQNPPWRKKLLRAIRNKSKR
mmetsp:Transcript_95903/g.286270  ORF Transcript_95903/g.286270 Transcript_95903/m.286270 type:complete len:336 (-) Transcript_95903:115-1122(-)